VVVSPEVLLQEVGGESVLLDLKSESYFGLDDVGTRIWRLVEQDGDLNSVHAAILAEYDVDPIRLERDLRDLIARLVEAGLVTIEASGAIET
jgi:hypothetical protein